METINGGGSPSERRIRLGVGVLEGDPNVLVACSHTSAVAVSVTGNGIVAVLDKLPWHAVREATRQTNRRILFFVKKGIICMSTILPKSQ